MVDHSFTGTRKIKLKKDYFTPRCQGHRGVKKSKFPYKYLRKIESILKMH